MKPDTSLCKPTRVYRDLPTDVHVLEGGLIDIEKPCNILVNWATTRLENPEVPGTLAVRWAMNGQRHFVCDDGRYAVDDSSYLLFNHGRRFASHIQSETAVDCYTVCFQPSFAEQVLRDLITPDDHLLDEPKPDELQPLHFLEKVYPHDAIVSPILTRLQDYRDSEVATHAWFEEQFHLLLVRLLQAHRNVFHEMECIPAARAATRVELYRRLHRARDFMEAGFCEPLTLTEIADVAWFSPHHFLRLFKQVFHETPHQYLTRRRIERARHLLTKSDISVTDICFSLGFESLGSFSWMFRRNVGVSPEKYRLQCRQAVVSTAVFRGDHTICTAK